MTYRAYNVWSIIDSEAIKHTEAQTGDDVFQVRFVIWGSFRTRPRPEIILVHCCCVRNSYLHDLLSGV